MKGRSGDTVSAYRRRAADTERRVDEAIAAVRAERDAAWNEAARKAAEAEANRHRFTADEVRGARAVRNRYGWHRVVRVNGKSVTVETPHSWTERIPIDQILEVMT